MIGKIKYALYGVAQNHAGHQLNAGSVRRHRELRPAVAFLPICVINDAGDKWRRRLCVDIRVQVCNFEHLL